MNYRDLYKDILKQISGDICTRWPESGFSHATWADLAENCTNVYQALEDKKGMIPKSVCLGRYLIKGADGEKVTLPYSWDWCKYRGVVLSPDAKYGDDVSNDLISGIRKIAASFLLRLAAQVTDRILIHKVDLDLDGGIEMIPNNDKAPIINKQEVLNQLLSEIKDIIAHQSTGFEWRCDTAPGMNPVPLKIVFISNWNALFRKENDGNTRLSDSDIQEEIKRLLRSEVAAKNGIYFVICASNPAGLEGLTQIRVSQRSMDVFSGILTPVVPDKRDDTQLSKEALSPVELIFEIPSDSDVLAIHQAKQKNDSGVLEDSDIDGHWTGDSSKGLRAIMGTTPQGENQYFELSVGRAQQAHHALIGGKTGTGKSVLLSEIICSLAERYSPEEFKLVLFDYKGGTEFYPFKDLPHVFALSAAMNAEFGAATLEWLCKERERREDLFKRASVKDLASYRKTTGEKLCRFLIIADEFQMLCNDKIYGSKAREYINIIARLGRSSGMHLILSTQSLQDAPLDGEAKEQFNCRVCLELSEADSYRFLAQGNNAPFYFTQAGQAVVNYNGGKKEENIFFRSGNKAYPKKNGAAYRDGKDVLKCISEMRDKALKEKLMPDKQYIYDGESFASLGQELLQYDKGFILGLKNNMTSDPFYLSNRQVDLGMAIIGKDIEKVNHLLQTIVTQTQAIYGVQCPIMTTQEYLSRVQDYPLTILRAEEGDMDLEDAIIEWQESRNNQDSTQDKSPIPTVMPTYQAPEGMESEFAEMMKGMNLNTMEYGTRFSSTRKKKSLPLIITLPTSADAKMMETTGLSIRDFRVLIYADYESYKNLTREQVIDRLDSTQIIVEHMGGVANKVRVGYFN